MTKPKPLPKIEKCACGKKAIMHDVIPLYVFIACLDTDCWSGPTRKTKRGARNAWNKVMKKQS